jgi:hypothetical protein
MSPTERPRSLAQEIALHHLDIFDTVFLSFVQDNQLFGQVIDRLGVTDNFTLPGFHRWLIAVPMNPEEKELIWTKAQEYAQLTEEDTIDWKKMTQASFGNEEYEPYSKLVTSLQQAFVQQFVETSTLLTTDKLSN